jgi:hypothetical protein
MYLQFAMLGERLVAHVAAKWSLPTVYALVSLEIAVISE